MGLYFNIALFLPLKNYENKEVIVEGYIESKSIKDYDGKLYGTYTIYVCKFDRYKLFKEIKMKLYIKDALEIGDYIVLKGLYSEGEDVRNYKGFSYKNYLKSIGIFGIIESDEFIKIKEINNINILFGKTKYIFNNIVNDTYDEKYLGFMQGLLLGNTDNLDDNIKKIFKETSVSHVLAISGAHIVVVLDVVDKLLKKTVRFRNVIYIFEIIFLFSFYIITGNQVSCFRSVIFNVLVIIFKLKHDKLNIVKNVLYTYILLLIFNIYNIINIGLYLSLFSSISLMVFSNFFSKVITLKSNNILFKVFKIFKNDIVLSISAQILILPIMVYSFNTFSLNFIISNIVAAIGSEFILKTGYICLILGLINKKLDFKLLEIIINTFVVIIERILDFQFWGLEKISKIEFLKLSFITPNIILFIIYFCVICFIIYKFKENVFNNYRIIKSRKYRNKFLIKIQSFSFNKIKNTDKKFFILIIVLILLLVVSEISYYFINKGPKFYFLDVGQGDCSLIKTNKNKTILIDSGEGESNKENSGENIIYPYLLDRKIKCLDYIIITHFDSDHAGGVKYLLEHMEVKNVIIGIQLEESELYNKILEIILSKNINLIVIDNIKKIKIDDVELIFLWPIRKHIITENPLNNNSLVFKLKVNNYNILFTGDIEEVAEKKILEIYKNNLNILSSDVLKVAHHGSSSSSTEEFLKAINPSLVVIGVGKDNKFGHPDKRVIERFKLLKIKIFRTDLNGEIIITFNKKIKVKPKFS